jgi:hypothetical protein
MTETPPRSPHASCITHHASASPSADEVAAIIAALQLHRRRALSRWERAGVRESPSRWRLAGRREALRADWADRGAAGWRGALES